MNRYGFWIFGASTLLSACVGEPVRRHVQFAAEDGWPRAETSYVNNSLRVTVTRTEPLREGSSMNAWLRMHDNSTVAAGAVAAGAPTFLNGTALGVDWSEVHEVEITEDNPSETPPVHAVLFTGEPGGTLETYVVPGTGSHTGLTATANIDEGTLVLTAPNLPVMGTRMYYGIWLLGLHPNGGTAAEPTLVGRTYSRGTVTFSNLGAPALRHEVVVTIELESGPSAPSLSAVVLRGFVPMSAAAPGQSGSAPAEPEPTGHAH